MKSKEGYLLTPRFWHPNIRQAKCSTPLTKLCCSILRANNAFEHRDTSKEYSISQQKQLHGTLLLQITYST